MSDHVWVVVALVAIGCAHDIPTAPAATLEKIHSLNTTSS